MLDLAVLLVAATLAAGPSQEARGSYPAAKPGGPSQTQLVDSASDSDDQADLPVSLDRIREKLAEPPAIKLDAQRGVYHVEVVGRKLSIEDILGPDYLKGPMPPPAGGMTHQEFLNLVTPQDVQGYAAFNNKEAATVAATSFATSVAVWALLKATHKLEEAKEERAREAARKEVQDALAELEKARVKAGLPPK